MEYTVYGEGGKIVIFKKVSGGTFILKVCYGDTDDPSACDPLHYHPRKSFIIEDALKRGIGTRTDLGKVFIMNLKDRFIVKSTSRFGEPNYEKEVIFKNSDKRLLLRYIKK